MHELGILMELVKQIERTSKELKLSKIEAIVLQVGEVATVIPRFLEECYPAAIDGTFLAQTKLIIEIIPANGYCKHCQKVYHLTEKQGICTHCGKSDYEMLSGREFILKELRVPWEESDEKLQSD